MTKRLAAGAALVLAMFVAGGAHAAVDLITNGSFENPNIGVSNYEYPGGLLDSWTYGGSALVNASGPSAWYPFGGPPSGFDGSQFAALQGSSTLSQTFNVTAGETAVPLTLSWLAAGRQFTGCCNGAQSYEVLIDGNQVGSNFSTTSGTNFTSDSLNLSGLLTTGSNTITFEGLSVADQTAFIDNVAISAAPEPAAWAMMLAGLFAIGGVMRQVRRGQPVLVNI
jgi:hypothetical protein